MKNNAKCTSHFLMFLIATLAIWLPLVLAPASLYLNHLCSYPSLFLISVLLNHLTLPPSFLTQGYLLLMVQFFYDLRSLMNLSSLATLISTLTVSQSILPLSFFLFSLLSIFLSMLTSCP